jgi:hypothetical protein
VSLVVGSDEPAAAMNLAADRLRDLKVLRE